MRFSNVVFFLLTLIFATVLASPVPTLGEDRELEKRVFNIGDVVGVAVKDLSKDPLAGSGNAVTKAISHPAIITDIDNAGKAIVAPISHTATSISQDIAKIAPSTQTGAKPLSGFVHLGDSISTDLSSIKKFAGGKFSASADDVAAIKNAITGNTATRRALFERVFNIGDVVGVAVKDLSKDPLAGSGNAVTKAISHPAIITDIDNAGKALVAPISHTATSISQDISKIAPSTQTGAKPLSGFVHLGDSISTDLSSIKKFAGGKFKASTDDVAAIKNAITGNTGTRRSLVERVFNIGDVVGVAVKDLSKDPLAGSGNAVTKAISHPAIITDIDNAGKALVAPISHTATSISQDISKIAPSTQTGAKPLSGFVHLGDSISTDLSSIKKFAGGKFSASAADVTAIKNEITKNTT